jgi:hypothetical protein
MYLQTYDPRQYLEVGCQTPQKIHFLHGTYGEIVVSPRGNPVFLAKCSDPNGSIWDPLEHLDLNPITSHITPH